MRWEESGREEWAGVVVGATHAELINQRRDDFRPQPSHVANASRTADHLLQRWAER